MIKELQTFCNFDDKDDFLTMALLLLFRAATADFCYARFYFAKSGQDLNLGGLSFRVAALLSHQFLLTNL